MRLRSVPLVVLLTWLPVAVLAATADEPAQASEGSEVTATASAEVEDDTAEASAEDAATLPFGGTISLSNSLGIGTFIANEFNKRPLYTIGVSVVPYFSITDQMKLSAAIGLAKTVVANADSGVSYPGQTLLSDLTLSYAYSNIVKDEFTGLGLSSGLSFVFPTGLASQRKSLILAGKIPLTLAGKWDWFSVNYTFSFTKYFHENSHPGQVKDLNTPTCLNRDSLDPELCFPGGYANASFAVGNGLGLGFQATDELSFGLAYSVVNAFTYDVNPDDEFTSENAEAGRGQRDAVGGGVSVAYQVNSYLGLRLGTLSLMPPKTRDNSSFRFPFFQATADNFTSFYFNVVGSF